MALQDARELLIARATPRARHNVDLNALEPRRARQGRGALEKARRRPKYARRSGSTSCCSWPRTRPRAWRPCANSDGGLPRLPRGIRLLGRKGGPHCVNRWRRGALGTSRAGRTADVLDTQNVPVFRPNTRRVYTTTSFMGNRGFSRRVVCTTRRYCTRITLVCTRAARILACVASEARAST